MNRVALTVVLLFGSSVGPVYAQPRVSRSTGGSTYAPTTYADYAAKHRSSAAPTTHGEYAKSRSTITPMSYEQYLNNSRSGLRATTDEDGVLQYSRRNGSAPGAPFSDVNPPAGTALFGAPIPTIPMPAEAVVTMTFPATAEVWLNGEKCNGSDRVWTFTSPTLPSGTAYLFDIRARWRIDGKTYETERPVAAMSGNKSQVTVVSGRFILE